MAGGYTGKVLRIDLTTGKVSQEDTLAKYKDYIGGTGLGYKVLWDEVPPGTKAWDPANRLIFGVGPLSGSGMPCSGRVSMISLWPPSQFELPAVGHMGGHWGPELKHAGWDSVIVQGKANAPCWISIQDDKVEIRDAKKMWGQGIFFATANIAADMGSDCHVAAIGQAGENLVRLSNVMNDRSHSAGGVGSVMGSKNLKAIGVKGTGAVKISMEKKAWQQLVAQYLTLMGCNNQGVVPSTPQPWAEYSGATRWTAQTGAFWGRATPAFDVGICPANDLNKMGLRTHKGIQDHGMAMGTKYTTRIGGCFGCPIRCHTAMDNPNLEQYGVSRYQTNTCNGVSHSPGWFSPAPTGEKLMLIKMMGSALADDYGWWSDYGQSPRDFAYMKKNGLFEKYLPAKEYAAIPWKLWETQDPEFLKWLFKTITYKEGELGQMFADGPEYIEKKYPEMKDAHTKESALQAWKFGQSKHHATEASGQVGGLLNLMRNAHAQNHTHTNFQGSGLPLALKKEIAAELFGTPDALDDNNDIKPMNVGKAKFAALSMIVQDLHDSLTMCNWTQPMWTSPRKDLKYRGDPDAEAKFFSAVTGIQKTRAELEQDGLRILTLFRALTIRFMNEKDMRTKHDLIPEWAFNYPKDKTPFTPGHYKMDRADMELAKDLFYDQLGYDRKTGSPTRATLEKLNLKYVAD
ncbi:MAG: aldehyde ferredoxin oxidoreductase, partial [Dehalococcoidales bacterium]|nr:aldehyde ferredoxin oxidoreductase [Dehalococcoidales bacterium]